MEIFSINQGDWRLSLELADYTESPGYDLGFEFEAFMTMKCTGFMAKTNTFYFTSRMLHKFYEDLRGLYKYGKGFIFESEAKELAIKFERDEGNGIRLDVHYEEIQVNDALKSRISLDTETLPYTMENISDFFLAFP